jgi:aldehyde dehydrogenase (NAD+)
VLLAHALTNNGQLHVATTRLRVHTSQADLLRDALTAAVSATPIGDPHDPATALGPLISELQHDRVEGNVASALAQGATLAYGGTRPEDPTVGYNLRPAIFTDVTNDMAIARDEIFGPVLAIIGHDTEADAIRLANDSRSCAPEPARSTTHPSPAAARSAGKRPAASVAPQGRRDPTAIYG